MLVTRATAQRTIRQKKSTMWRNSWPALPIIQVSIWWPKTSTRVASASGTSTIGTSNSARTRRCQKPQSSREAGTRGENPPSATASAQAGKDAEQAAGQDQLQGEDAMRMKRVLEQVHRVGG